nr:O-antigen ligase family protein [uncultured Allomuricauda sp.]
MIINSFIENGESSIRSLFNLNYSYLNLGNTLDIHPTYYSYFILTATIVTVDLLKKSKSKILKFLYVFLILYFSFFIVHLSSRIGLMGLYLVLLYNVVLFIKSSGSWKKGALILAVVHLTLFAIVWNIGVTKYRIQHIFGFEYYTGYKVNDGQHKLRLWGAAIKANHNFLFGNGMGDINRTLKEQYASLKNEKAIDENYNAHNQFIEYYVGIGILGLFTFLYILYNYTRTFLTANNYMGLQFIVITSILCLTESLWSRHHGIVFFVMMLGVFWQLNKNENQISLS